MKSKDVLALCEHILTEMDIDLMEWQGHLDMTSLAGVGLPQLELWTDDDPPVIVTVENAEEHTGKQIRVMAFTDGGWGKIGDAQVDHSGKIRVLLNKEAPVSVYEELARTPGSGVVEMPDPEELKQKIAEGKISINDARRQMGWLPNPDNHPFFAKE